MVIYTDPDAILDVTVNQTDDDSEIVLHTGWAYTVTTTTGRLRGTLDLRASTDTTLFFHGYTWGEWFRVSIADIRRVER